MQRSLTDFRIENDAVIFLAFTNGQEYRVNPKDLSRFLSGDDLQRVRNALRLRRQFMRRILPPTAMMVVALGIVGLGAYDVHHITSMQRSKAAEEARKPAASPVATPPPTQPQNTPSQPNVEPAPPVSIAPAAAPAPAAPAPSAPVASDPVARQPVQVSKGQSPVTQPSLIKDVNKNVKGTLKGVINGLTR